MGLLVIFKTIASIPQTLPGIGVARIGTTPENPNQSSALVDRWSERPDGSRWVRARTESPVQFLLATLHLGLDVVDSRD